MRFLREFCRTPVTLVLAIFLASCFAHAQDQQSSDVSLRKRPAARAIPAVAGLDRDPNGEQDSSAPLQPDSQPLTGVQSPGLGSPEIGHSYFVPGIQLLDTARSIALDKPGSSSWSSTTFVAGNMSLYRATSSSQFSGSYTGGGYFSSDAAQGNGLLHELGLTESFKWRRWNLSLIDQFSFLPESAFGFGLGTGISIPGISGGLAPSLPGLQTNYQPNQSILTSTGPRYSNSFATEVVYAFRRSSINVAGTYAILRFLDPGNIDSDADIFNVGYNYQITGKNSIGVLYRFTEYHFFASPQGLTDHAIHIAFGRKITGRLALQLLGGPEISHFRQPVDNEKQRLSPSGSVILSYAMPRGEVQLSYSHGVSNGGGLLVGSETDQLRLELDRHVSRRWNASFFLGFARNGGLGNFQNANQRNAAFDSYFVGAALNHPVGRDATLSMAYSARIQISTQSVCATGACGTNLTQHQVSLGASWHTRPLVLH
jgi:hypothetical protein